MLEVSPGLDSKLERNTHLLERVEERTDQVNEKSKWKRGTHNLERTEVGTVRRQNESKSVIDTHFLERAEFTTSRGMERKQTSESHSLAREGRA